MEHPDGVLSPNRRQGDQSIFKKPNWPNFDFDLSGLGAEVRESADRGRGRTPYITADAGERGVSFGANCFEEAMWKQEGTSDSPGATATTTATTVYEAPLGLGLKAQLSADLHGACAELEMDGMASPSYASSQHQSTEDLADLPELPSTAVRLSLGCVGTLPAGMSSLRLTTPSWMLGGPALDVLGSSSKFSSEVS